MRSFHILLLLYPNVCSLSGAFWWTAVYLRIADATRTALPPSERNTITSFHQSTPVYSDYLNE